MTKKMWGGRFTKNTDKLMESFSSSISYDQKLAKYDVLAGIAHAKMLGKCKIIPANESALLVKGLSSILSDINKGKFIIDEAAEDIHTYIQNVLEKKIGIVAEKLHTARSRNDLVVTDLRMYCKVELKDLAGLVNGLQKELLKLAKLNKLAIIPGYTHLQRAQCVLFSHYALAYIEQLERDKRRLNCAYRYADVMPLGSCALAGTTLAIDRKFLAKKLGFSEICENSLDAVSDRDFVIMILEFLAIMSMHLSRFAEDMIIYSTNEFKLVDLPEEFCTGSSLMPHKKNPDLLELVRGASGKIYGNLNAVLVMMKGLALSYNRDMQHDKKPLFEAIEETKIVLELMRKFVPKIKVNKLDTCCPIPATEFAEYLVKKGISFKQAHAIVGTIIKDMDKKDMTLTDLTLQELKKYSVKFENNVFDLYDPNFVIKNRVSLGSASFKSVKAQIKKWEKTLNA